ncbi:hypothetical protein SEA_ERICMILLARD_98 [Mycobacterium phage EricMillard]|nr:hypothetical protein SEA_ERICMILLARD_98 [Mycobacterium phage EricMillard]
MSAPSRGFSVPIYQEVGPMRGFDKYQQALLAGLWALCDAQPPEKQELRRLLNPRTTVTSEAHVVMATRAAEDFHHNIRKGLTELSRSTQKYPRYAFDKDRRGTGVPNHRKVRVNDGR